MSVVISSQQVIDCSKLPEQPFVPDGWDIVFHQKLKGLLDLREIILVSAEKVWDQMFKKGGFYEVDGVKYMPFNACLLDYFRENSKCIPSEWKEKVGNSVRHIFFPGTEYLRSSKQDCIIRYFFLEGGVPGWFCRSKDSSPESNQYVALITCD